MGRAGQALAVAGHGAHWMRVLHTQQQVVLEGAGGSGRQRQPVGNGYPAEHAQPAGQVLQPSWLVHHAQGRAVEKPCS